MEFTEGGILVRTLPGDPAVLQIPDAKGYKGLHTDIRKLYGRMPTVTWHYSAMMADAERYNRVHALDASVQSSWHFWVCRDGTIIQCRSINDRAWTQGRGTTQYTGQKRVVNSLGEVVWEGGRWKWPTVAGRIVQDPNQWTIGIEVDNVGPVVVKDGGDTFIRRRVKQADGAVVPKLLPVKLPAGLFVDRSGKTWEAFAQLDSCRALRDALNNTLKPLGHWRHQDLDPRNKQDPGPAFPFDPNTGLTDGSPSPDAVVPAKPVIDAEMESGAPASVLPTAEPEDALLPPPERRGPVAASPQEHWLDRFIRALFPGRR